MSTTISQDLVMTGQVKLHKKIPPLQGAIEKAAWPRMIKLDDDTEERLKSFLDYELEQCYLEREPLIADWTQWQTDYWAKPEQKEKNFPFKRAANIVIPLSAIAIEAIYSRVINTLFALEPFWSIRPRTKDWIEAAPAMEEWLQIESEGQLDVYRFCSSALMELIKLGTCVGKSGYQRDVRKVVRTIAGKEFDKWVDVYNGATLDHVPLANFLIRLAERDPQKALWVGEEHEFTWSQLKKFVLDGRMDDKAVDYVKTYWSQNNTTQSAAGVYNEHLDKLANTEPGWTESFKVQELWLSFDVDGDGVDEEIILDYCKDARCVLSIRYNWNDDLHRPYRIGVYIPVEGRIFGIGVGKQNEQFQKLITTIHRQRLDNSTLTNMAQLAIKKGGDYGPGEPIFPGKLWFLDDPQKDIREIKMTDTYTSVMNNEQFATSYWEKLTGANDVVLGVPSEGTPGTATGDLTRLAEGNKKFDLVLKNIRHFLGECGQDVVANYQQFGDGEHHWITMGEERGSYIDQMLQMPSTMVRDGAIISVTVTDSITNREVQKQQWMGLFTLLSGYYDKQMQNAAATQNPQIYMMMGAATMQAGDYMIRRLIDTFREANLDVDSLLVYPKLSEMMDNALANQPPIVPGADTGPPEATQGTGIPDIFAMFGSGGGGNQPSSNGGTQQGRRVG